MSTVHSSDTPSVPSWVPGADAPRFTAEDLPAVLERIRDPAFVVTDPRSGAVGLGVGGGLGQPGQGWPMVAALAPLYPEWLGHRSFNARHGTRFAYVQGAMANGIATTQMVAEVARAGGLGFFGAAGLPEQRVAVAVDTLIETLGHDGLPWGANLIHSPQEPDLEEAVADLYIRRGVRRVSASAFMALTPAIVRYAAAGLHQDQTGRIIRTNAVFAKVSRPEVARRFLEPAPAAMLDALVAAGKLTATEAALAAHVPVAEDFIVESDSGGHTDNRPLTALLPVIQAQRDQIQQERRYAAPIRVGAAGGLGTPSAVAAAFALGADFVVTGSVNQGCVESGLSDAGREMLAQAGIADVAMAPAADMFEMGVEVQVLRRGTMFAQRARLLYEIYRAHTSLDDLSPKDRGRLERNVFKASLADAWSGTAAFWQERDPREVAKAEQDPHHKMALLFRSYLGRASKWAIHGEGDRRTDFQVWCGPAMGAFNDWVRGSFLEPPHQRTVAQVARNLMEGAAVLTRAQQLRAAGVPVPSSAQRFPPRPLG